MAASNKDSTVQVNNNSYNLLNERMYLFKGLLRLNSFVRNAFAVIFNCFTFFLVIIPGSNDCVLTYTTRFYNTFLFYLNH
jgi:hypothetical protein